MKIQLSKREKNILLHLLMLNDSITSEALSKKFAISIRTAKYDLENIRYWLKSQEVELSSKRGKGVWLDLKDQKRLILKNELLKLDKQETSVSQEKRINQLVFSLLTKNEYLTSEQLSQQAKVSQNTIINDLERMEHFLLQHQLVLIRKNRKGFKIEGEEINIRLLLEKLIQNEISEYDLYNIMNHLVQRNPVLDPVTIYIGFGQKFQTIYLQTLNHMAGLLREEQIEKLNYSEILSITIRTTIAIFRLLCNKTISHYKILSQKRILNLQEDISFLLVDATFTDYEFPILEAEFDFIYGDIYGESNSYDIQKISRSLIQSVGEKLDYPFHYDGVLYNNLFAHLSLRLTKKHLYLNEYNPFVIDIKAKHNHLFTAIKTSAFDLLKTDHSLVNDSFISYIALHFLVSIEKLQVKEIIKIVYVCSTGLGVTSLLQQKIKDELTDVEIVSFASILNLREEVKRTQPDLIISIFPIENMDVPWIKVNPLPSKLDIQLIQENVAELKLNQAKQLKTASTKSIPFIQTKRKKEEESKDVIVKGFIVYEQLKNILTDELNHEYLDSFLLHVLLMVHRVLYHQQYGHNNELDNEIICEENKIVMKLEQVFSEQNLAVNLSEIVALLQYIKKE